ncbi:conserved hypothetical protein [Tenacibaculum maritimum]|uniref:DUF6035 family protein n=1 Tax=Tenacibaculum maritimum TaxID=107401 RepID=UPI0012E4A17B|nr:DUF6035 family protein [Tenacibaculum maritimum]CAA0252834.1 conserved hypothetical protein [Tenacibaculum maritimum]
MAFERSIKSAIIKETGDIIESDEYFKNKQDGDEIRTEYNRGNITFLCLECRQKLSLSKSKKRTFYLKHFPSSEYCELKEESLSSKEQEIYTKILIAKESPRHIFLKNKIGELLKEIKDVFEVKIDDYFIFNDKGKKRKPDVYFKYLEKEIVFEIQLSNLSQKYILGRHDFYKEKGIYLIWVLDNFDVEGNTTTELDIKYLSQHHNYFRFKDTSNFKLNCKFKQTQLNTNNQFYDKWNEVDITLEKLKFDKENSEVYFYNFLKNKDEVKAIQIRNQEKIDKLKEEKRIRKEQDRVSSKNYNFFQRIAAEKEKHISDFSSLSAELSTFSDEELVALNISLAIDSKGRLFNWLKNGNNFDYEFFDFLLSSMLIEKNINNKDKEGNSICWYLFNNDSIYYKEQYLKLFFKNGFKFLKEDEILLKNHYKSIDEQQRIILVSQLSIQTSKWLIDNLFEYKSQRVLCIIESCLENKIVGFKFKGWIALFNYAIHNYPEYWEYIELTIKYKELFSEIISLDKKGTFQSKIKQHTKKQHESNEKFGELFADLYPEIV